MVCPAVAADTCEANVDGVADRSQLAAAAAGDAGVATMPAVSAIMSTAARATVLSERNIQASQCAGAPVVRRRSLAALPPQRGQQVRPMVGLLTQRASTRW